MDNFIKNFSIYNGKFEFVLDNNNSINKVLFYFNYNKSEIIFDYINKNIKLNDSIRLIFNLYGDKINHIGFDTKNNRFKFYINLYNNNFKKSLEIINKCKKFLNITEKYFLEKNFHKFDCIGFDISDKGIDMKIYEIINEKEIFLFKYKVDSIFIKEIGYLKNFHGRRKKFYRFNNKINFNFFEETFNFLKVKEFEKKLNKNIKINKRIKYFCIEKNKEEVYFV